VIPKQNDELMTMPFGRWDSGVVAFKIKSILLMSAEHHCVPEKNKNSHSF
jgi:hypothetical protein